MIINISDRPANSEHLIHPKYRPDIDGLRAIAILSVVVFHAFPSYLRGGFIGVDIFFVISGFLISTIIIGSLEQEKFSFVEFYSRRVKRIFPALLLVLIACFTFGWFTLVADEYKQLGKQMAGGAGFVSNILFLNESGYFDRVGVTKPLLNLWSLGVEEQFYILWPVLLWFAWKRRLNLLLIAVIVGVVSFSLNIFDVKNDPSAAFYLPQTRFWELMTGSILAYLTGHKHPRFTDSFLHNAGTRLISKIPRINRQRLDDIQSVVGTLLIATGLYIITNQSVFPGWWALMPTFGTVMIIAAGPNAIVNRLVLANRILVWFGLISFPLYLWHWPLLSFAHIVESKTPTVAIRCTLLISSVALAWLTYRFLEIPLRSWKRDGLKTVCLTSLMVVIGSAGVITYEYDGLGFRNWVKVDLQGNIGFEETGKYIDAHHFNCVRSSQGYEIDGKELGDNLGCANSKVDGKVDMILMGDSHAGHLFYGLAEELNDKRILFLGLYGINGLPFITNDKYKKIFSYVLNSDVDQVMISLFWQDYRINDSAGGKSEEALLQTVDALIKNGKTVYLVTDGPLFSFEPAGCKYVRPIKSNSQCSEDSSTYDAVNIQFLPVLQKAAKISPRVIIIDTTHFFCYDGICSMRQVGKEMFADTNHLNILGSRYVAKKMVEAYPQLRLK